MIPFPDRQEIHLYRFNLKQDDGVCDCLRDLLTEDERQRADRFLHGSVRRQFIVARGRLRQTLSAYVAQAPEALSLDQNGQGKPFLLTAPELCFNLSHSGSQMLLAISHAVALGVDIEQLRLETDIEALSRRFFTTAEHEAILALDGAARRQAFFACWTRKEAVIKALGSGLAFGLGRFAVSVPPDNAPLSIHSADYDFSQWTLLTLPVADGYHAAVATQAAAMSVTEMESLT